MRPLAGLLTVGALVVIAALAVGLFRDSFRDCLPWKPTPGGKFRWLKVAVEELAHAGTKAS